MSDEKLPHAFRSLVATNAEDDWRKFSSAMVQAANSRTEMYVQAVKERDEARAERDAALAEVQQLREAASEIVVAFDTPQPRYDRAENGELSTRLSRAIEAARALVSPP